MQSLTAPHRYTNLPGNADLVYRSICMALSDRGYKTGISELTQAMISASWHLLLTVIKDEGWTCLVKLG